MKKRLLAMFLALALCTGLAIPAFAAEADDILKDINGTEFWIDVEDVDSLRKEIPVKLRFWDIDDSSGSVIFRKDAKTYNKTVEALVLPLGVTLTAGPDNQWVKGVFVYTDHDGDGIYEQRLESDPSSQGDAVVPVTEAGPLKCTDEKSYYSLFDWSYGQNFLSNYDPKGYRVLTTDYLVEIFGANTLIEFWDAEDNNRYILLTGEERPEDLAYDRLGDRGINVAGGGLVSAWAVDPVNEADWAGLLMPILWIEHNYDLREKIDRAEFAFVAVRLYIEMSQKTLTVPEDLPFEDVPEDHALVDYIALAHELGIVNGTTDTTFSPDDLVTREQAAAMLGRVYTALGGEIPEVEATAFADDAYVSGYAKSAVAFMNENGVIGGVGNNTFSPKGDATVEEALKIAVKMMNSLEVK